MAKTGFSAARTFLNAPFIIGIALAATGIAMMAGWTFRMRTLIELVPGYHMVFATAAAFALAGTALACTRLAPRLRARWQSAAGAVIGLIGAGTLAEYAFGWDLGIDLRALHGWLSTMSLHPGRPAIAAAAAFCMTGVVFIALGRSEAVARSMIVAVALIGFAALAGNVLGLDVIYGAYPLAGVSSSTAAAFILLALGLWPTLPEYRGHRPLWGGEASRIIATGTSVVLLVGAVAAVGGFLVMQKRTETVLEAWLAENLGSQANLVREETAERLRNARLHAESPAIRRHMKASLAPDARAHEMAELERIGASILRGNAVSFRFVATDGTELAHGGARQQTAALRTPVPGDPGAFVAWNGRFELETRNEITDAGQVLGVLELRQPLRHMAWTDIWQDVQVRFCATQDTTVNCFPARGLPGVSALSLGRETPQMVRALEGSSGVLRGRNTQGLEVIAAYAPLGELGLGMVANVQARELFAPLRGPLQWLGLVTAAVCAFAIALLLRSVAPLVQRLARSEKQLHLALDGSHLALFEVDARSGLVTLGEQWNVMRGGEPIAEVATVSALKELLHPEEASKVIEHARMVLTGESPHYDIEHRVRKLDGSWMWVRSRGDVAGRDRKGHAHRIVGTNAVITERKRRELVALQAAAHDPLTGLPNRRLFDDRLRQGLARSRRSGELLAVLCINADKFKPVNDAHGHALGDAVLKRFGTRLAACVRSTDTVARLAGDEFAVILEGLPHPQQAHDVAEKIVRTLREPFEIQGERLEVSASVGVAVLGTHDNFQPETLLERADRALYQAKRAGRDRYALAA